MSEEISSNSPGQNARLYLINGHEISEHEPLPGFVFLNIDDSSMPDSEIAEHVSHMIPTYLGPEVFKTAESSLSHPEIIVRSLLAELGVQADLDEMRIEARIEDGILERDERLALQQTVKIERLYHASIAYLDEVLAEKKLHDFVDMLEEHITEHHSDATILKARNQLVEQLPHSERMKIIMVVTQRILWTMLYLNDTTNQS